MAKTRSVLLFFLLALKPSVTLGQTCLELFQVIHDIRPALLEKFPSDFGEFWGNEILELRRQGIEGV